MNADHLEFCASQTWFCPMRWLASNIARTDNPLWKPKTTNQQWYQRLSILANVLKYPTKTHLGFLAHHSTISGVIHLQRHSKNGSIFEPGLVIRRFLWTQWHASNRFLWIQWSWGGIYIHPELMGEVKLVKFTPTYGCTWWWLCVEILAILVNFLVEPTVHVLMYMKAVKTAQSAPSS